jgi:hypothetical protein
LRLAGLVSRSDLIEATLALHDEEQQRQTIRRWGRPARLFRCRMR